MGMAFGKMRKDLCEMGMAVPECNKYTNLAVNATPAQWVFEIARQCCKWYVLCLQFQPATGPIKGKTSMSVTGLNLGKTYTDIRGGITVAGVKCQVKPDHYEASSGWVSNGRQLTMPCSSSGTGHFVCSHCWMWEKYSFLDCVTLLFSCL